MLSTYHMDSYRVSAYVNHEIEIESDRYSSKQMKTVWIIRRPEGQRKQARFILNLEEVLSHCRNDLVSDCCCCGMCD